jgi:transglutaminase-like putative cysteine protease
VSSQAVSAPAIAGSGGAQSRRRPDPAASTLAAQGSLALRLAAFFGLAAFAAEQYATLLLHPPAARVLGVAAIAAAGGGGLALSERLAPVWLAGLVRVLVVVASVLLGLLALGVPAHLLGPAHWGALRQDLRRGVDGLDGGLWPYRGGARWSRLAVLALVPVALAAAAATAFWPARRSELQRRLLTLATLLALLTVGIVNQVGAAWRVQGVLLAVLIVAWLWLPTLAGTDVNRAVGWLLASLAPALVLAPLLSAGGAWIDYRSDGAPAVGSFQWDQTYGPKPWSRSSATMFEIAEPSPALLKVSSLDRFDGLRFMRSASPPGSTRLDTERRGGGRGWYTRATVSIVGLRSSLLVSGGGQPVAVRWLGGGVPGFTRAADGAVSLTPMPTNGASYEVTSYAPPASASTLARAGRSFPRGYLAYTRFELPGASASGLALVGSGPRASAVGVPGQTVGAPAPGREPASDAGIARRIEASPYRPMFALARRLALGQKTTYGVVTRIEQWLLRSGVYDERTVPQRYPLETFVFASHRGYCQQFSGAMALMLRMDGIPARVAVGFRPSVYDAASRAWQVRALDAHSWVEVYFAGVGWVAFDPTPQRTQFSAEALTRVVSKAEQLRAALTGHVAGARATASHASRSPKARSGGGPAAWTIAALVVAAMLVVILSCWWLAAARRLRGALAGDAAGAVAELQRALPRTSLELAPATTLAQLESRAELSGSEQARRYLRLLSAARYGAPAAARPGPGERAHLRRALSRGGLGNRLRALLALPPGAARRAR